MSALKASFTRVPGLWYYAICVLAGEAAGVKVFAGEFVSRHGLNSASNAQRAVQALLEKDIIDRDNGSFLITDRFFRLWIHSAQSA